MTLEPDTVRKFRESLRRDLMLSDDNEGIFGVFASVTDNGQERAREVPIDQVQSSKSR
jgi:hypothetical protein